jgi:hypothetical protein
MVEAGLDTALFLTLFLFAVQTAAGVAPMRWPNHTWLAGLIFYVSGFFAIACLVWWSLSNRDWLMPALQPLQVIALGLAIALGGLIWQWKRQSPPDPQIAVLQNQVDGLRQQLFAAKEVSPSPPVNATPAEIAKPLPPRDVQKLLEALDELYSVGEANMWPVVSSINSWSVNWRGVLRNSNAEQMFSKLRDDLRSQVPDRIDTLLAKYPKYDATLQVALALDFPAAKNELSKALQEVVDGVKKLPKNAPPETDDLVAPQFKELTKQSELAVEWWAEARRRISEMQTSLKNGGTAEYAKR